MNEIDDDSVRLRSIYTASFPDDVEARSGLTIGDGGGWGPPAAAADYPDDPVIEDDSKSVGDGREGDAPAETFQLPQSTHTLLFTQPVCSVPFAFSVAIVAISYTCLILVLRYNLDIVKLAKELRDTGNAGSTILSIVPIPANINFNVRLAQYLALIVGLFMDEEIPTGIYMLRMFPRPYFERRFPNKTYSFFVLSSIVRIVMGYLFLINVFMVLILSTGVIDMFYDFLALQFVQQLDDIGYTLSKWDVLGKSMHSACAEKCFQTDFEKERHRRKRMTSIFLKAIYIFNFCWLLAGMAVVSTQQVRGYFQCDSITVDFGDEVWEGATVKMPKEYYDRWAFIYPYFQGVVSPDQYETWTLVFSYFNGVYKKNGTHAGRPIYKEMRKLNGTQAYGENLPYEFAIPAEIKYCEEISAWVFSHPFIHKKRDKSGCNWLLRSQETEEFDLLNVDNSWKIWTGVIGETKLLYADDACTDNTDCNLNGMCIDGACVCNKEVDAQYLGVHCEVKLKDSCRTIIGDDVNMTFSVGYFGVALDGEGSLVVVQDVDIIQYYSRPIYYFVDGADLPAGFISVFIYTGSQWFGYWMSAGNYFTTMEVALTRGVEYHAFWARDYDPMITKFVSEPTVKDTPAGVNIYRIENHGDKSGQFGPFGELHSFQNHNQIGRGLFRCAGEYIPPPLVRKLQHQRPVGKQRFLEP